MRKLIVLLIAVFSLSFSSAFAQTTGPDLYAGAAIGAGTSGISGFGFSGYFGARDLISDNIGVRGSLSYYFGSSYGTNAGLFRIAADAIYDFDLDGSFGAYAGAGLRFASLSVSTSGVPGATGSASASGIGLGFLGGGTYIFTPQLSGFAELGYDFNFSGFGFFGINVGVTYDF